MLVWLRHAFIEFRSRPMQSRANEETALVVSAGRADDKHLIDVMDLSMLLHTLCQGQSRGFTYLLHVVLYIAANIRQRSSAAALQGLQCRLQLQYVAEARVPRI